VKAGENPFRIGQHVRGEFFTDRADEVQVVLRAMRDRGRLLVWGPRRMGKSTVIGVSTDRVRRDGGIVLTVDLSTVTSLTEAADRLLAAVSREERWQDRLLSLVRSLAPIVTLGADPEGRPRLAIGLEVRKRAADQERGLLSQVLDRVHGLAAEHDRPVVFVLDEVQQLGQIGGDAAEWLLRGRMQEHRHTAYVCAGSKESLVREMLQPKRAFYSFFELLHVGPIDRQHLGRWIDERMSGTGVKARDVGQRIVVSVGPRTQDVMLTARTLWFRTASRGRADPADVKAAMDEIVTAEDPALRRTWEDLTPLQQRVLKAVAGDAQGLHSEDARSRFELGPSSSVTTAITALTDRSILERRDRAISFDSPFFRRWVEREVLRPEG
jgi:hypothetical protein